MRSFSCRHCWRRAGETKPSLRSSQRGLVEGRGGAVAITVDGTEENDEGQGRVSVQKIGLRAV